MAAGEGALIFICLFRANVDLINEIARARAHFHDYSISALISIIYKDRMGLFFGIDTLYYGMLLG